MSDEGNRTVHDPGDADRLPPPFEAEPDAGPIGRQDAFLAERMTTLRRAESAEPGEVRGADQTHPEVPTRTALASPADVERAGESRQPDRQALVREYRERQRAAREEGTAGATREIPEAAVGEAPPQPPAPPPANNWVSIGPSVLRQGQGGVQPPTSGRTVGFAIAPGGSRVYAATANGGVWRSDNAGETWRSLMESWDLNPLTAASDSLACGAIAGVFGAVDRIYVGSGEGDGGAFNGVGPIVSFDGGTNWVTENVAPGSPSLAGSAFYALAVDPANPNRVVAGTRQGLFRRESDGAGGFHWARKTVGALTWIPSVCVARQAATTTFYAARWGGPIFTSANGSTWAVVGTGFPTANVGRVGVATRSGDPHILYALVGRADNGHLHGLYRLDLSDGTWRTVTGVPGDMFGPNANGQANYDLALAVDPNNANRIYLGGATVPSGGDWSGALYRCEVTVAGTSVTAATTYIGNSVHADIHALVFAPGDSSKLWVGCDGGVFYSTNPGGTGDVFQHRNAGLATLTMEHLGQHPTEDAVLFCGSQDNGGQRFTGEEAWLYSSGGDAGFQLVNWSDPYQVLSTYVGGSIRRSTTGGARYSYADVDVPLSPGEGVLFYAPIAGTPRNPAAPAEANIVAFGSIRPWISTSFGGSWTSIPSGTLAGDSLNGSIRALAFASATRLYAATLAGGVYRFDRTGANWQRTQINTLGGANALALAGPITDLAVDAADATGSSIYLTFGGTGDYRHVWHFDGTSWQQRSGPAAGHPSSVLDVQANAIAVDPASPSHVYVGADIGVWHSADGGSTWAPFSEGLPDAGVMDLALHAPRRLLRAATHGRSVYERSLDTAPKPGVELYVRDTQLDQGRFPTVNGLPDPVHQGQTVVHYRGPDIKLDTPDVNGHYQFPLTGSISFFDFDATLSDDFQNVATHATATITTRAYVQVHNRGVTRADNVQVMLLLANASAGLPPLPAGYAANVQSGTPITTSSWRTVGFATLNDVRPGAPKIAAFNLTSNLLPPPAMLNGNQHHCVLALIHHPSDPFVATQTVTDSLSIGERKTAHKNLTVVQFVGSLPAAPPIVLPIRLNNPRLEEKLITGLAIATGGYRGRLRIYFSRLETDGSIAELLAGGELTDDDGTLRAWAEGHLESIEKNQSSRHPYDAEWCKQRVDDVLSAVDAGVVIQASGRSRLELDRIVIQPESWQTIFLVLDPPARAPAKRYYDLDVQQLDAEGEHELIGGISVRVECVPQPRRRR